MVFLGKKKKEAIFLPSKQFYNTMSKMHKPFSLNKKGAGLLCCSSEQGIFHSNDGEEYFISGISHKEQAWLGSLFWSPSKGQLEWSSNIPKWGLWSFFIQLSCRTYLLLSLDITIFTASGDRELEIEHLKSEFIHWALNLSLEPQHVQLKENQPKKNL